MSAVYLSAIFVITLITGVIIFLITRRFLAIRNLKRIAHVVYVGMEMYRHDKGDVFLYFCSDDLFDYSQLNKDILSACQTFEDIQIRRITNTPYYIARIHNNIIVYKSLKAITKAVRKRNMLLQSSVAVVR